MELRNERSAGGVNRTCALAEATLDGPRQCSIAIDGNDEQGGTFGCTGGYPRQGREFQRGQTPNAEAQFGVLSKAMLGYRGTPPGKHADFRPNRNWASSGLFTPELRDCTEPRTLSKLAGMSTVWPNCLKRTICAAIAFTLQRTALGRAANPPASLPGVVIASSPASSEKNPIRRIWISACVLMSIILSQPNSRTSSAATGALNPLPAERQVTRGPGGRIITNTGVWSSDSEWIVYDTRSDAAGNQFDGATIEMVNVRTGGVKELYRAKRGAHCGVATFHPREQKVAFILGPENPAPDWEYGPWHRQGVIVDTARPGSAVNLDARDLTPPFTPGALRGGSHVHVWDAAGDWVSFTYEDHVLAQLRAETPDHDVNLRNIGVSIPRLRVRVKPDHPRNHDGEYFSVLVTRTTAKPKPGSDEINKAFEEGWVGTDGYSRADGTRQNRSLAFQGQVLTAKGKTNSEIFIVDLPDDLTQPGDGPLAGTETRMPLPPKGCVQRRLTFTAERRFPGIQGPRHWLRASPDGSRIAFLMKDDEGIAQLWTVSPNGGRPAQVTRNPSSIASTFTWSPDGRHVAHVMDNSVCITEVASGATHRLTSRTDDAAAPRPEACVFSPDGKKLAYVRRVTELGLTANQIFVLHM